jgi:putative endonuclease
MSTVALAKVDGCFVTASDGRPYMFYTYILESECKPGERYIGHTSDLKQRLFEHNSGKCPHSAKFRPWKIKTYIAFEKSVQAQDFERYLKSGSGHAFASRHFK